MCDSVTAVQVANTELYRCVGIKIKTELQLECGPNHEYWVLMWCSNHHWLLMVGAWTCWSASRLVWFHGKVFLDYMSWFFCPTVLNVRSLKATNESHQHIHVLTHNYSVVTTTLLHELPVLMSWTTSIIKLGLFDLNYTPFNIRWLHPSCLWCLCSEISVHSQKDLAKCSRSVLCQFGSLQKDAGNNVWCWKVLRSVPLTVWSILLSHTIKNILRCSRRP